jgi:hypothetical protein
MAVRLTGLEAGQVAGEQNFLSRIGHERHFTDKDIDKLVLAGHLS